jgi:16S rRNA (uracil1498-N3)-methyltransferase
LPTNGEKVKHLFRFIGQRKSESQWEISKDEIQHLLKVLRLSAGDHFEITNGSGWVSTAEIISTTKSKCDFKIINEIFTEDSSVKINLFIGALKPSSLDDVLAPLVELGVRNIFFFTQAGGEKMRISEKVELRANRIIDSALKQCKSPYRTSVTFLKSLEEAIEVCNKQGSHSIKVLVPGAEAALLDSVEGFNENSIALFIGGEKGWQSAEIDLLTSNGAEAVHIGSNILRAWTAAIAVSSAISLKLSN